MNFSKPSDVGPPGWKNLYDKIVIFKIFSSIKFAVLCKLFKFGIKFLHFRINKSYQIISQMVSHQGGSLVFSIELLSGVERENEVPSA